jgi:hypothetical protein
MKGFPVRITLPAFVFLFCLSTPGLVFSQGLGRNSDPAPDGAKIWFSSLRLGSQAYLSKWKDPAYNGVAWSLVFGNQFLITKSKGTLRESDDPEISYTRSYLSVAISHTGGQNGYANQALTAGMLVTYGLRHGPIWGLGIGAYNQRYLGISSGFNVGLGYEISPHFRLMLEGDVTRNFSTIFLSWTGVFWR